MQIGRTLKRLFQLVTDSELYFLIWLAIRTQFRKTHPGNPAEEAQKRAKAVNAP